jgi:nitroreductase
MRLLLLPGRREVIQVRTQTPRPAAGSAQAWRAALEVAADRGRLAPSVHNTQPWTFVLFPDRLELRADRTRQLGAVDPQGRELVQSIGAALFSVRASLAASRFAAAVTRWPDPADPDLLAVVRRGAGRPDPALPPLDRAASRRHTNRRPFGPDTVPADVLEELAAAVTAEDAVLLPLRTPEQRALAAASTQDAERLLNADPAYREELWRWTGRSPAEGDGVPPSSVPRTTGRRTDAVPVRDFDQRGTGGLPRRTGSGTEQTLVLLATARDDVVAWLRAGEALQRLLLELTRRDWAAGPLSQPLELPATRARLGELTAPFVPQMLLRVGRAAAVEPTARRPRRTVLTNGDRLEPVVPPAPASAPATTATRRAAPVSDGRGGTTWR